MKTKLAILVGAGLAAAPAAATSQVGDGLFQTLEECTIASTAYDRWSVWSYVCVPTANGFWTLEWVRDGQSDQLRKGKRAR